MRSFSAKYIIRMPDFIAYKPGKKILLSILLVIACQTKLYCQEDTEYFHPLKFNPSLAGSSGIRGSFDYHSAMGRYSVTDRLFSNTFSYDQNIKNTGIGVIYT